MNEFFRHEEQRKKLWCDAWIAVAGSSNCVSTEAPRNWADQALALFDQRFPAPKITIEIPTEKDKTS